LSSRCCELELVLFGNVGTPSIDAFGWWRIRKLLVYTVYFHARHLFLIAETTRNQAGLKVLAHAKMLA
jgi:hypothetical protein